MAPTATRLRADCAVIGAGLSGLAAATTLHDAGVDTMVVEARDRVGGRAHSIRLDDELTVDLGGQWRGIAHHRLTALAAKYDVDEHVQRVRGSTTIHAGGRSVTTDARVPTDLGLLTLGAGAVAMWRLDRMARHVPTDRPWAAPAADRWDRQTLDTWLRRNVHSSRARSLLHSVFAGTMATDPGDVSLLHVLAGLHTDGAAATDLESAVHGSQYASFATGMQGLAERIAASLGDRVHLGHPVRRIVQRADRVRIEADKLVVDARRVIVAIPPTLAGRIDHDPPMPGHRDQLTQRMAQGSAIKCIVVYDTPFWRDAGHSGLIFHDRGPVNFFIDGTRPDTEAGVLIGFMGGANARRAAHLSPDDRRSAVIDCLAHSLGPRARKPRTYLDKDWAEEPFTRGCYSATMPPGAWTSYGPALRKPVGAVHWAGTETARTHFGLLEGALEAGERAADEVRSALEKIDSR